MRKNIGVKPALYPQPVMIIGTYNEDGTANAMNAAWGGMCGEDLIIIDLGPHRTTENIKRTAAFTVSVADEKNVVEADYVGVVSGDDVPDKLEKAGWTTAKSDFVNAPIINELPMAFECELVEFSPYGVVGKIKNVSIDESVLNEDGSLNIEKMGVITFDPINMAYVKLGEKVGNAFSDGNKMK